MPPRSPKPAAACATEPLRSCGLCPRLRDFRQSNQVAEPDYFNAPVPTFGAESARLLIVGLAPGLRGANRTGRPFTGDYAGDLLYATLLRRGFASGSYGAAPDDGLTLADARITNAVRCVPPQNKPTPAEINQCRPFLIATIESMPSLSAIVALGRIAHESVVSAFAQRKAAFPFAHGRRHELRPGLSLFDSYHCSRYNTNTGVLTPEMFDAVFVAVGDHLGKGKR